ncbi:2318_t:CDS:2 [Funneliformis caledonium]|uniref:2318_t:CDS:1 n=1 Tax=Funneliformis caledonium TaxID=1117310 RepID=A0A9N9GAM9_9GLOM|nr:2318_t:CDS:2 [Funneliformis caledonium]
MLNAKPDFIFHKSDLLEWLQQLPINLIKIIPSLYEEYFESKYITHITLPPDTGIIKDLKLRSNLSYLVQDACLARGEEKGFDTEGKHILQRDLFTCDLNKLAGHVQAFITRINISRLLPLICQTIPRYFQQEFIILYWPNGKHKVPFTNRLEHVNDDEAKIPFVVFLPKGMALYEIGIMYRVIRWKNVLKYIDWDKWFIIDFDNACYISSPTSSIHLAKDSYTSEIFEDHYNESVDIWSVSLMEKDVNDRPTAKDAL